jgi:hypothetical protein
MGNLGSTEHRRFPRLGVRRGSQLLHVSWQSMDGGLRFRYWLR